MIVERPRDLLIKKILAHGFLLIFLALIMFPFLMVISISFREGNFTTGDLLPSNPTLEHWYLAFGLDYTRADGTVVHAALPGAALDVELDQDRASSPRPGVLAIATISAYAFSRIRIRGKGAMLDALFLIQMFPTTLALVAIYAIFDALGAVTPMLGLDSHLALILIYLSGVTLHIWTIKGYFDCVDVGARQGGGDRRRHALADLPLRVPAAGGADHGGGLRADLHRHRQRLPDRDRAAPLARTR